MSAKPIVAIVGRPNVGKSTFFNTISGHRISIVEDKPGVTRDRIYSDVSWCGKSFTLVDTGGIDTVSEDMISVQMRRQAELAIEMADVICFFVDVREGMTGQDREIAAMLRKSKKPILLVANKLDHKGLDNDIYEYYELGLGDPIGISCSNLLGLGDLLDAISKEIPDFSDEEQDESIKVAIVGRPNVGKSSIVNSLLGQERVMVSPVAGTTRDAVDTEFKHENGTSYCLIDTAGIRRKRAIEEGDVERYSVIRSFAAVRRADVCLLVIDANEGVSEQDTKIAGVIRDEGKACIVVINKWDAIEKETGTLEKYRLEVLEKLNFMSYAPVLFVSALTGKRMNVIFENIDMVYAQASKNIPTGLLNDCIGDAQLSLQPPMTGGRRLKIYYATQNGTLPPSFILFVNDVELMHFAYERYLENQLRKHFDFVGTPIKFVLRPHKEEK